MLIMILVANHLSTKNIVFSHANGFPGHTYKKFLNEFDDFNISYINIYGMGNFPVDLNWKSLTQELISHIEENFSEKVIALGHSFGGVISYFAASLRPDLISRVIAIDPPLFGPHKRYPMGALRLIGKEGLVFKLPAQAKKRKNFFESREEAAKLLRRKKLFKNFDEDCFNSYIEEGFVKQGRGYSLSIPPELESELFRLVPCIIPNHWLSPKDAFIFSSKTSGVHDKKDKKWLSSLQGTELIEYSSAGHMWPLEKPKDCANIVKSVI